MNSRRILLCGISVLFSILIFSGNIPTSLSESDVRTVTIFVEPPKNNEPPLEDNSSKNDEKPNPQQSPSLPQELPTTFVTGNDYALNSDHILISSQSGIALNNLLIEQIQEWENDANHTDDFWSRTDQLIMGNFGVVNALHDPLTENNYHMDGIKYSENINSNLDYYVQERGYDINNLESVPNHMVTPQKYDLSRAISKQWENPLANNLEVQHVRDLRDIAPNAMDFTPEQEMQMFRESVKTTSFQVVGSLMPKIIVDESMFLPESDSQTTKNNLENSLINNEDDSLVTGTTELKQKLQENTQENIFQQTAHIKDTITASSLDPNYATQIQQELPLFEILISILLSVTHISILYHLNKYGKSVKQTPLLTINEKYDYLFDVESLLHEANSLYKNSHIKDAYEKLSQSIRVFYSNKLNLEKEIVTSDLIPLMKNFEDSEKSLIKKSLHLSDMIEFAKHSDNNSEFNQIIKQFSNIVKKEKI
ncbi:hypothetical protein OAJ83_00520 [Candidatus Nitrosopelagicus sp.]|nr:hypothetical protein [Candidatus Nitrosopelagicus sp.]